MATAIDIVNAVIETSSTLKENIPLATNATLQATGGAIMQYTPFMNEFISGLVNRILFQEAHNMTYDNQLCIRDRIILLASLSSFMLKQTKAISGTHTIVLLNMTRSGFSRQKSLKSCGNTESSISSALRPGSI